MTRLTDIQTFWAKAHLYHIQQPDETSCSSTCLIMLEGDSGAYAAYGFPSLVPTNEMPLYATRLGIYLEQQPVTATGFAHGTYLILRRNHWFILRFMDTGLVTIHDPEQPYKNNMTLEQFNTLSLDDVACIFRVLWTTMP